MSNDNEPSTLAELKQANLDLKDSLQKCQALVAECREKLEANGEASFLPSGAQQGR